MAGSGGRTRWARALAVGAAALVVAGCSSDPTVSGTSSTGAEHGSGATDATTVADDGGWGTQWTDEQRRSDPAPQISPVALEVPYAPTPFAATDGKVHLTYEVEITNTTPASLTVDEVEVVDGDGGDVVASYEGDEVAPAMARVGSYWFESDTLAAGQTGMVFVDVAVDDEAAVPEELVSTVSVTADLTTVPEGGPTSVATPDTSVPVTVARREVPVIGPPLAGDGWTAFEGCCDTRTHHRYASYSIDGHLVVFERYAIDFVQLGDDGQAYAGEDTKENYVGYGADLVAVADATVVAAVDGQPENEVGEPQPDRTLAESMGNHVILDLGGNVYAVYAHLQTGSLAVEPGDHVSRGQVLGHLGNSGQSTNPHLHFHLLDNPTGTLGQGIPFVIDTLTVAGSAAITAPETLGITVDPLDPPSPRTDEYPLTETVVDFPPAS